MVEIKIDGKARLRLRPDAQICVYQDWENPGYRMKLQVEGMQPISLRFARVAFDDSEITTKYNQIIQDIIDAGKNNHW